MADRRILALRNTGKRDHPRAAVRGCDAVPSGRIPLPRYACARTSRYARTSRPRATFDSRRISDRFGRGPADARIAADTPTAVATAVGTARRCAHCGGYAEKRTRNYF